MTTSVGRGGETLAREGVAGRLRSAASWALERGGFAAGAAGDTYGPA